MRSIGTFCSKSQDICACAVLIITARIYLLHCTVSNMQVSLLGVFIGTGNMFSLPRGVRHDQRVFVIWAFVTTWRAPPKIVGVDRGGGGTKSSYTHRLFVSLSQP